MKNIIYFYYPDTSFSQQVSEMDPDRDWAYFNCGRRIWVLQTYLSLRKVNSLIVLTASPPQNGIVLLHHDDFHLFWNRCATSKGIFLISIRADREPNLFSDLEITQNGRSLNDPRCRFIPHWPQPGLIPRDKRRADRIQTVAYKGFQEQLHSEIKAPSWRQALEDMGLDWVTPAVNFDREATSLLESRWEDYSEVDVSLAIRPASESCYPHKPASKLVNAWLAGVPSILGSEFAYNEARIIKEDFLEAHNSKDALIQLAFLQEHPEFYSKMRTRCVERAKGFTRDVITQRWAELLFNEVPKLYHQFQKGPLHLLPFSLRASWHRLRSPKASRYLVR